MMAGDDVISEIFSQAASKLKRMAFFHPSAEAIRSKKLSQVHGYPCRDHHQQIGQDSGAGVSDDICRMLFG